MNKLKFLHLQIGQQFEYQGKSYTKVAPLIASDSETGKQKMIPRSALINVAEDNSTPASTDAQSPSPAIDILERYHQTAVAELQALSEDETKIGAARARLERLRQELLEAINNR